MADTTAAPVPAAKVPTTGEWTSGILDIGDDLATGEIDVTHKLALRVHIMSNCALFCNILTHPILLRFRILQL